MRGRRALVLATLGVALWLGSPPSAQSPPAPAREITKIAGEVYRFRNANHYSVFAVTPAGVVATDPINADAARWLRDEIGRRFNQPIRYVVYSHDDDKFLAAALEAHASSVRQQRSQPSRHQTASGRPHREPGPRSSQWS